MRDGPFKEYFHTLHPPVSFKIRPYMYHSELECPEERGGNGGGKPHRPSCGDTTPLRGDTICTSKPGQLESKYYPPKRHGPYGQIERAVGAMAESEEALPRPNNVVWEIHQKETRQLFIQEGAERRRDHKNMESFY